MYYYVEVRKGETIATIKRRIYTHFANKETRDRSFDNVKRSYKNFENFKSDENSFSFKKGKYFEVHMKLESTSDPKEYE